MKLRDYFESKNIEFTWDQKHGLGMWYEIYYEGDQIIQVDTVCDKDRFVNGILFWYNNPTATEFHDDGYPDYITWSVTKDRKKLERFLTEFNLINKKNGKH